jgi:hypothetical protein
MPYSQAERSTLFASALRATAIANSAGTAVSTGFKRTVFLLDVTATAGAAGDVLDVYVDVLGPDGATWINAVHFTQVAGNSAAIKHYAVLDASSPAATTFNVTSDCAAGVTKPYVWGDSVRGRYTLVNGGGGTQSVTFSLTALSG